MSDSEKAIPTTSGASEVTTVAGPPCTVRATYAEAAQALNEALARKRGLTERAATMTRARAAAQSEADTARQQWRGLLREAEGSLTRDIQKLRAAEASALTLVEEYGAMHQEIGMQVMAMEVSIAELAELAIGKRNEVIELVSREAFAEMVAEVGDVVARALVLYKNAASVMPGCEIASEREVRAAFLEQLGRQVDKRVAVVAQTVVKASGIQQLELTGVNKSLIASPIQRALTKQKVL
ncbi:hypothetical protein [Xanthomonas cannabis]|uniref:hypothetical protein n=1 Tax=Xanthomonas cannabis TaxID=1885674 RepID=UPI00141A8EA3|nr:hypothetical protein [Xanthomonas cannabis]NIK64384.1 hypothetical protein [Xanthomonas cannabis]